MVYLQLFSNLLEGQIPAELGGLQHLTTFDASNNSLTGTLPPALGGMSGVGFFNVKHNNLSGAVPQALCTLVAPPDVDCDLSANVPGFRCPVPAGCQKCRAPCSSSP